jgi:hypothetical protein
MKLEMGESLVFLWLKHEKQCQSVQMNWKASKEWSAFAPDTSIENDTSELFVRALKLKNLMENKSKRNMITTDEKGCIEERKIGQIIREAFDNLSETQSLFGETITCLLDAAYSKKTFGLNFALLINNEDDRMDEKGRSRYYATPYSFNGKEYFLCSQWFEKQKDDFVKWYNRIHSKTIKL